jgi:hypothetical protein
LATRDFLSLSGLIAKNAIYEVLDPVVWCALLAEEATFVHAGAVASPDGDGLVLMGSGGVGKTTAVLDLVSKHGWKYIGDDLVILSKSRVYRYPKHLQIYAYNTEYVPGVEGRILEGRSRLDRLAWHGRRRILGVSQVRRRVSASAFFGEEGDRHQRSSLGGCGPCGSA